MRQVLITIAAVSVVAGAGSACATKKFVRGEVDTVNGKVETISQSLEATQQPLEAMKEYQLYLDADSKGRDADRARKAITRLSESAAK